MDFQIGMVEVAALVLGITQGVKALFGVEGRTNQFIAFGAGLVLVALEHGITEGLISPEATVYIEWAVKSLGGALAAIGVYSFGKRATGLIRKTNGK